MAVQADQGVEIPLLSTSVVNEDQDFTVMMWFKISDSETAWSSNNLMYLFSFEDSVSCYITFSKSIMCDTPARQKLQVKSPMLVPGKWLHITLSVSTDEESYLQLSD